MLPVGLFSRKRARLDLRNHRKIAIVDVLRLTGPAVLELQYIFAADWFLETNEVLQSEDVFPGPEIVGPIPIQVLASGPDFPTQNNQRFIVALIHGARKQIKITTPYFIPDELMLQALQTAVLRGVDVHLVLSEIGDQVLVSLAQRSYYEELLEAGVKVPERTFSMPSSSPSTIPLA
jgi:cardiolipin synthase